MPTPKPTPPRIAYLRKINGQLPQEPEYLEFEVKIKSRKDKHVFCRGGIRYTFKVKKIDRQNLTDDRYVTCYIPIATRSRRRVYYMSYLNYVIKCKVRSSKRCERKNRK